MAPRIWFLQLEETNEPVELIVGYCRVPLVQATLLELRSKGVAMNLCDASKLCDWNPAGRRCRIAKKGNVYNLPWPTTLARSNYLYRWDKRMHCDVLSKECVNFHDH